ncbi:MAG: ATP-binding cassette domain-containing protein, partial [Alphaproteobacteria bacterium]
MAPQADAPLVRFEGVRKSYDGRTDAVHALDFSVARGEFVTLLGPSGSGKTTTLMMLAGFEDPTAGRIVLDGRPINDVPAHRRGIGVVDQHDALLLASRELRWAPVREMAEPDHVERLGDAPLALGARHAAHLQR